MATRIRPSIKPRCQTCRRRKIKCDYAQPSCGPCSRSRIRCERFQRALIFVPQQPDSDGDGDRSHGGAGASNKNECNPFPLAIKVPDGSICNRDAFFDQFLSHFLPRTASDKSQIEMLWVHQLPDLRRNFKPLDTVANAYSVMLCARANHDDTLHMRGMRLYGQALEEIGRYYAGRPQRTTRWYEAALTSIMLQLYESSDDVKFAAYGPHLHGISQIMQMNASEIIIDSKFKSLLLLFRITTIIQSVMGNFKQLPSTWCCEPWGSILDDPLHKCMDVLVHIPKYREIVDQICDSSCDQTSIASFHNLRRHLHHCFESWYMNEVSQSSPFCHFKDISSNEQDPLCQSLGYNIVFNDLRGCMAMVSYWVGRLLLFEGWERARHHYMTELQALYGNSWKGDEVKFKVELAAVTLMADNLCLALREILREESGIASFTAATLPLWAICRFFSTHGMVDRLEWCHRLVKQASSRDFAVPFLARLLT